MDANTPNRRLDHLYPLCLVDPCHATLQHSQNRQSNNSLALLISTFLEAYVFLGFLPDGEFHIGHRQVTGCCGIDETSAPLRLRG
jgi:hypothetical protein